MNNNAPLKTLLFVVKETTLQLEGQANNLSPDEALKIALEAEKELLQYKNRRSRLNKLPIILK